MTRNQPRRIALQIICALFIISVFSVILLRYYGTTQKVEKENPRFVKVDYLALQQAAQSISAPASNATAKNVIVLNYHVVTKDAPSDEYEISYEQFKENMFALKRQGYETVSLQDFYLFMRGEKQLPDKSFVLTFDDGAKATYYNADPVLHVLNYTAVMFVITGASLDGIQRAYYLNESELRQAQESGRWELESHTATSHFRLPTGPNGEIGAALTNKLWLANDGRLETDSEYLSRVTEDLHKAKSLLENDFNKTVIGFALPYGDFGEQTSNYPEAHSILYNLTTQMHKLVFYQFSPAKTRYYRGNYGDVKAVSYVIIRLSVDALRDSQELVDEIEASRALELPYVEQYTNKNRWPTISGEMSLDADKLVIRNRDEDGFNIRLAYLDGSYLWKDYTYSLRLNNSGASTVLLISRLKDSADYAACRYGNGQVKIVSVDALVQTTVKEVALTQPLIAGTDLSMTVSGSSVACSINGNMVLSGAVPAMPAYGGVGVRAEGFAGEDKTFAFGNITIV